jgi:hypothetical protein
MDQVLQFTSCLFATVVVRAYALRCTAYHHLFLLVTVHSILFHSTHHPAIARLDKCVAHVAFVYVLSDIPLAHQQNKLWLVGFPATTLCIWCAQSLFPNHRKPLHAGLHLVSVIGMHCFLVELHSV